MEKGSMTVEGTLVITLVLLIMTWGFLLFFQVSLQINRKSSGFYQKAFQEKIQELREIKVLREAL